MTNLANYIRFLVNAGILLIASRLNLPEEGLSEAAVELTDLAVYVVSITGTWAFIRYIQPKLPEGLAGLLSKIL